MTPGPRCLPALSLLLAACVGEVGEARDDDADPANPGTASPIPGAPASGAPAPGASAAAGSAFRCAAPAGATSTGGWRRLSSTEYRNTVRDLLAFALKGTTAAAAVVGQLPLSALPDETGQLHGTFRRMEQEVWQDHVRGWHEMALAVGRAVTTRERIGLLMGACATDASADNDSACLTEFVARFGERAFRRPLSEDEVLFYRGFYGAGVGVDPAGVADVVAGLLSAPPFVYLTEHGGAPVAGKPGVHALTAFELAARLSYHFWETMPDQGLWEAARSGALATTEGFDRELERVVRDPRTRRTLRLFFEEWLRLAEIPPLNTYNADPVFKAFAGADLPRSQLRDGMIADVLDLVEHTVWEAGGGLDDLLLGERVFPRTPELARIYGVEPWTVGTEPPRVPAGERPGLLTRAALLASGTANTRPILRGAFIRTGVLCDEVPPPPNGDAPPPPALSDKATTRQTVEALTEASGTACAGCHRTLINPLGFALEGFDALGRKRSEQRLFARDGREVARAPVDTASVPQVVPGDLRASGGPADLARLIVESGKASACLARNYFRFTHARGEDLGRDGCSLERLRASLVGNRSLRQALRDVALGPEFRERAF